MEAKLLIEILKLVKSSCERISEHRQPFAWGAMPITTDDGQLRQSAQNGWFSYNELYRQDQNKLRDEDLFKFLAEMRKPGRNIEKLEKLYKTPNGDTLSIRINMAEDNLVDVLTSSLHPVVPYHAAGGDPYFETD